MTGEAGQDRPAGGGPLRGCGIALGLVALLAVGALGYAYVQLQQLGKGPEGGPIAARWETWDIALRADDPLANGRLHLVVPGPSDGMTRSVVSIGLPETDPDDPGSASLAPADRLVVPGIRLSITGGGAPAATCLAPCEQGVAPGASDWSIVVEAVDGTLAVPVRVTVGAGVITRVGEQLPEGVEVSIGPVAASTPGG